MTRKLSLPEVGKLLTLAASNDRRTIGKADALAWAKALKPTSFTDAEQAIADHYADETRFIMPADINRRTAVMRRERIKGHVVPAPANPDDTSTYLATVQASRRAAALPPGEGPIALTAGFDAAVTERAAQFRRAGGGRVVEAATAEKHVPAGVVEALAEARRQCEEGARRYRGDDPPRKRWVPPADPAPRRLTPLSAGLMQRVVDNPPPAPHQDRSDER